MRVLRAFLSLLRGTSDQDAFREYKARLLEWACEAHGLSPQEYAAEFEKRYVNAQGIDLFLDFLLAASKGSPSFITDHPQMLADRVMLYERFGVPILTMLELRDKENERLRMLDSPLRL